MLLLQASLIGPMSMVSERHDDYVTMETGHGVNYSWFNPLLISSLQPYLASSDWNSVCFQKVSGRASLLDLRAEQGKVKRSQVTDEMWLVYQINP